MKHLGIDYGQKRIGIALSDEAGKVAFPKTVFTGGRETLSKIHKLIKEEGVGAVVLGESRDLSGAPNPVMEDIEQFKTDLAELCGLPVHYEREFFTSALAARQFAPEEKSRKQHPDQAMLDASAAALILQSYLDRNK